MKPHIFPEIYVSNVPETVELFKQLFNARVSRQQADFAELYIGETRILLNELIARDLEEFEERNPVRQAGALEHLGAGLELGIFVNDLEETYKRAKSIKLNYLSPIKLQEWGLKDFRFLLPDGYYIRVTSEDKAND